MELSIQETEKFYKIWWQLLAYVNNKFSIFPEFDEQVESERILTGTVMPIREKLWSDKSFLDTFVSENSKRFTDDELDIVKSWKHRIAGDFFIYRHLAKHTIFLDDKASANAYGVYGIRSPIEDIIMSSPPVLVKAVLLPFKDKIIYDGFLNSYIVSFGGGYRRNLDLAYRNAKEREGIITSLIPQNPALSTEQSLNGFMERNNLILKAFNKQLYKSGLSAKMVQQHTENIEMFSNKCLMDFDPPRPLLDIDRENLMYYFDKVLIDSKVMKKNAVSFKRFVRFLAETQRLHLDDYWTIIDLLKTYTI